MIIIKRKETLIKIFNSIFKLFIGFLIVLIILIILYYIFHKYFGIEISDFKNKEKIQEILNSSGGYGKLVFIVISFLQVTFIPIPSMLSIMIGSYLFGFFQTLWMSTLGILLGSFLAFLIGRKVGRPFVNWVVGDKKLVEKYLKKVEGKEALIFFLMLIFPFFPDDPLCSVAGITKIKFKSFALIQIIGRPISILFTLFFANESMYDLQGDRIILLVLMILLLALLFLIYYYKTDEINELLKNEK